MSKQFKVGQYWNTKCAGVAEIIGVDADAMVIKVGKNLITMALDGTVYAGGITGLPSGHDLTTPALPPPPILGSRDMTGRNPPRKDMTIRELQTSLPWTIRYSTDFRSSPVTHKDFAHTLHHVSKAAGKLHGLADDMDHDRSVADTKALRDQYAKYIADLIVCAFRLANTFPGGVVDLQAAVQTRIEEKNGVTL